MSENVDFDEQKSEQQQEANTIEQIIDVSIDSLTTEYEDWDADFGELDSETLTETFIDFSPLEELTVLEAYPVNDPFAHVAIVFDEDLHDHRYLVFEPELLPAEAYVREDLDRIVRNVWRDQTMVELTDETGQLSKEALRDLITRHAAHVPADTALKLLYYLDRDFTGHGPIDPMMRDGNIEDISCVGYGLPLFIYHREFRDLPTNRVFESEYLDDLVVRLAQRTGEHLTRSMPRTGGALPDGSRIQLTLGEDISDRGSNFTIRKFQEIPLTPIDLIDYNTFSVDEMAYLWFAIENNKSILFVGPTASGKTTSMNAVSLFLPPNQKVVTIEQIRELVIPHENWVASVTRQTTQKHEDNAVDMYDLLQDALHQRPEYLLVGEIRTEPEVVRTFFHSVFTGHPGGTTFHAKDTKSAVDRLMSEPLNVPEQMINAIDMISVQRQVFLGEKRVRRNYEMSEVFLSNEQLQTTPLFQWDPTSDTFDHAADLYGDSSVLQEIASERGWDELRINEELYQRRSVLEYLLDNGYKTYDDVISAFYLFSRDREYFLEKVRADTFDPEQVEMLRYA